MIPPVLGQSCGEPHLPVGHHHGAFPQGYPSSTSSTGHLGGQQKAYNGADSFPIGSNSNVGLQQFPGGEQPYGGLPPPGGIFPGEPPHVTQQNGQMRPQARAPVQGHVSDQLSGPMGGLSLQTKPSHPPLQGNSTGPTYPAQPGGPSSMHQGGIPPTGMPYYTSSTQLHQQTVMGQHVSQARISAPVHPQAVPQKHLQAPSQGIPQATTQAGLQPMSLGHHHSQQLGPVQSPHQGPIHAPPQGPPLRAVHSGPPGPQHVPQGYAFPQGPPHASLHGPPPYQQQQQVYPIQGSSPLTTSASHVQPPMEMDAGTMPTQSPYPIRGPQQQHHGLPPRPQGMPQQLPQPARKLDPDQMPSPIQVIEDDRKSRSGDFYTNKRGQVPPLVTTRFVVHDEGLSSPRYIRSTIYSVPCTSELLKQTSVPFALSISPLARPGPGESELPLSDFGEDGPIRCIRCKAYMCPLMQFIDGGRRFQCVFCKGTTEVPQNYFAHLDHLGQRSDKFQRPELCLGSYEIVATKEYCKNSVFPNVPAFLFLLDVSYNSVQSGLVSLFCQNIKEILAHLPREHGQEESQVKVGFITYSSVVHFYSVKANLAQPQMLVVPDVHEMFVPLLDGCLVSARESSAVIDSLVEQIPTLFGDTRETETVLGSAIQAGLDALKAAECSGKLFVFHTTLPIADAPGKLKNRDDRKLLGTDKEKSLLTPQTPFYSQLGQECVGAGCCVDLFLFHNAYIDVATIGQVAKMTGGQVYKYTYFQAGADGNCFLEDLRRDVSKPIAFDAVMRVRTSTGIRPTDFYGNYFMSNTTDVELAALDSDKCITVEVKYDDKLTEEEGAYIQVALLYTSCSGQRRLRVLNLALAVCSQMADLYRNCDLDTLINCLSKQAVRHLVESGGGPRQVKEGSLSRAAQMLASYRKHCAAPSSSGQLILPESMKLLPLYINCVLKSDAISGGAELTTDDRSFAMLSLVSMDVSSTVAYFYPRLLPLHEGDSEELPVALRCTVEKIQDNGVYLLENGIHMFLWIGMAVEPGFLQDVFAQPVPARVDIQKGSLLELNTPASRRVRSIIERVRQERARYMRLTLVRQGDKMELVFRQFLVEDRQGDGSPSYVDFLCHLHKEIRDLLS